MFGRFTANGYLPIEVITYKLTLAKIANFLPVGGLVEYGTAKSKYLCLEILVPLGELTFFSVLWYGMVWRRVGNRIIA